MTEDHDSEARETQEMRRALGLIAVALAFAVVTGMAVVGVGSHLIDAAQPDRPVILIAAR